ncbi:MAG: L,D-transpeptidase family protein [Actinomycetota bacterium]
MSRRGWSAATALLAVLATFPVSQAALAGDPPSVTLSASETVVDYGGSVTLSGTVAPPAAGETVEIRSDAGDLLAQATTDDAGAYSTDLVPEANGSIHAAWNEALSSPVDIGVRAVVTTRLAGVRLFDSAVVRGSISPPYAGATVTIRLVRAGKIVVREEATTDDTGAFLARIPIEEPGGYRARATFGDDDHLPGTGVDGPKPTPLPSLRAGSNSAFVRLLEARLVDLRYRLVAVNNAFDYRTADAVVAFAKVQGMTRSPNVDPSVWRALADPKTPSPKSKTKGFHIEIDQSRQVLYTVENGDITNILHVSTGKPSTPTHDGTFHVVRKLAGYSAGYLYYPSYFDGGRAIHGWTEVPTYAASHGCVRVPYWNAKWIFGLATYGTRILIYH